MLNLPYNTVRQFLQILPWFPGSQIRKALKILGELGSQKAKKQKLSLGLLPYTETGKGSTSPGCRWTIWALSRKRSHINSPCKVGALNTAAGWALGKQAVQPPPSRTGRPEIWGPEKESNVFSIASKETRGFWKLFRVAGWTAPSVTKDSVSAPRWNVTMNPAQVLALKAVTVHWGRQTSHKQQEFKPRRKFNGTRLGDFRRELLSNWGQSVKESYVKSARSVSDG